jgi:hypothetical protein
MIWLGVAPMAFGASVMIDSRTKAGRLSASRAKRPHTPPRVAFPQVGRAVWLRQVFRGHRSYTGTRYRIRHGRMMNVDQLDPAGNKGCEWCFLPDGNSVANDVILAQKVSLETFESEALATANRNGGFRLAPSRTTGREAKVPAATAR